MVESVTDAAAGQLGSSFGGACRVLPLELAALVHDNVENVGMMCK